MKDFFKKLFCTRYRIYPTYQGNERVGFIVYERAWLAPIFTAATLDIVDGNMHLTPKDPAVFKERKDAVDFIKARTETYDYETIHSAE
jgi:hypothetical protein